MIMNREIEAALEKAITEAGYPAPEVGETYAAAFQKIIACIEGLTEELRGR
jgi:hypothetical protein